MNNVLFGIVQLDLSTSGHGGIGPFVGICLASALFGIADAHVQGGMAGELAYMRPEFLQVYYYYYYYYI